MDFVSRFEAHIANLKEVVEKDDQIELAPPEEETYDARNDPKQKIENLKLRIQEIRLRRMEEEEAEEKLRENLGERK